MKKCFEGMNELVFKANPVSKAGDEEFNLFDDEIMAMVSREYERVDF